MRIFAIFGDPIEHSLSPVMQNAAFRATSLDACYHAFRVTPEGLRDAIAGAFAMGFGGVNLTIPLKEHALEIGIVEPDGLAAAIGAVNTISFGSRVEGHNTDGPGAIMALEHEGIAIRGRRCLLIGAGGAARAIAYALRKEGAVLEIANRSPERARQLAASVGGTGHGLGSLEELVKCADIIVNATSVGMHEGDPPLFDGRLLGEGQVVFDIVYNRETQLLRDARAAGAKAIDGVMMLVFQGAKAIEIWTGRMGPVDVMERAVRDELRARWSRALGQEERGGVV